MILDGEIHARAKKWAPASDFGAPPRGASPRGSPFSLARVYFAGIAKIRDYSQSIPYPVSDQTRYGFLIARKVGRSPSSGASNSHVFVERHSVHKLGYFRNYKGLAKLVNILVVAETLLRAQMFPSLATQETLSSRAATRAISENTSDITL